MRKSPPQPWRCPYPFNILQTRAASSHSHPHICTVYDVGEDGGAPFLVLELLEGEALTRFLSRNSEKRSVLRKAAPVRADTHKQITLAVSAFSRALRERSEYCVILGYRKLQ